MTSDNRLTKSPSRGKSTNGAPAMMQKSLLSFFKTAAPAVNATNDSNTPSSSQLPSNAPTTNPPRTPVKRSSSDINNPFSDTSSQQISPLFSTDEAVLRNVN